LTPGRKRLGAPYGFFSPLAEVASMFSSKELAVVANVGSWFSHHPRPVSGGTVADPQ